VSKKLRLNTSLLHLSKLGFNAGLLAEFVGGDAIEFFVAFDGNYLRSVGVNGVICTLSEKIETMLLQVSDEITSFDRHAQPLWAVVQ
jgi:hypothetical protein